MQNPELKADLALSEMAPEEEMPAPPILAYGEQPTYHYHALRMTWLVTGVLEFIVGLRLVLKLLGANADASFVQFVYFLSWPLEKPFDTIFVNSYSGKLEFESGSATAMVIILALVLIVVAAIKILSVPRGTRIRD